VVILQIACSPVSPRKTTHAPGPDWGGLSHGPHAHTRPLTGARVISCRGNGRKVIVAFERDTLQSSERRRLRQILTMGLCQGYPIQHGRCGIRKSLLAGV